jgi:citrate synthase
MVRTGHLSAGEAAEALDVSLPTLYAYVSRGLIRSEPQSGRSRARRYRAEDVASLKSRRAERRDPARVAETALHWGMPVLDSGISLIADGRLYYRGHDVVTLATENTIEEVASLLWSGTLSAPFPEDRPGLSPARWKEARPLLRRLSRMEAFRVVLSLAEADDATAFDLQAPSVRRMGARIFRLLATTVGGMQPSTVPVAELLERAWAPSMPQGRRLFEAALILCADHELNVSTFTVRCTASGGSSPYAMITAGLAALEGVRHGGASAQVEALFREAGSPKVARATVEGRLRRGEIIPGFGHPLYSQGDPRGAFLLRLVLESRRRSPGVALARALCAAAEDLIGQKANIDFALVALCRAFDLAPGTPLTFFALGRTIGWIAHAIEQVQDSRLIRPRARYVGELPIGPAG